MQKWPTLKGRLNSAPKSEKQALLQLRSSIGLNEFGEKRLEILQMNSNLTVKNLKLALLNDIQKFLISDIKINQLNSHIASITSVEFYLYEQSYDLFLKTKAKIIKTLNKLEPNIQWGKDGLDGSSIYLSVNKNRIVLSFLAEI